MRCFRFTTDCVSSDSASIRQLIDAERSISYRTFRKHCEGVDQWATDHGYDLRGPGLTLARDQMIGYYRSEYQGQLCYFIRWSAIEYIWTAAGTGDMGQSYGSRRQRGRPVQRHVAGKRGWPTAEDWSAK